MERWRSANEACLAPYQYGRNELRIGQPLCAREVEWPIRRDAKHVGCSDRFLSLHIKEMVPC